MPSVRWGVPSGKCPATGDLDTDKEAAAQIRLDELERDVESSTYGSGGDVTARIFILKGYRPDRFQERAKE